MLFFFFLQPVFLSTELLNLGLPLSLVLQSLRPISIVSNEVIWALKHCQLPLIQAVSRDAIYHISADCPLRGSKGLLQSSC